MTWKGAGICSVHCCIPGGQGRSRTSVGSQLNGGKETALLSSTVILMPSYRCPGLTGSFPWGIQQVLEGERNWKSEDSSGRGHCLHVQESLKAFLYNLTMTALGSDTGQVCLWPSLLVKGRSPSRWQGLTNAPWDWDQSAQSSMKEVRRQWKGQVA